MRARIAAGDGDARHGTLNGYSNLTCRCVDCRAAWNAYFTRRKVERANSNVPRKHGLYTTYFNWMCRCVECKAACAEYQRKLRAS